MDVENISPSEVTFAVGELVDVQARTWPGINKLGGTGFIKSTNPDSNTYSVTYVLGGREDGVEAQYIARKTESNPASRKRNQVQALQPEEFRKPTTKKKLPQSTKVLDRSKHMNKSPATIAVPETVTVAYEVPPSSCDDSESIAESEVKLIDEASGEISSISREISDKLFLAMRDCARLPCEGYLSMDISNYFLELMPNCEADDVEAALEAAERDNKIMIVDDEGSGRIVYVI